MQDTVDPNAVGDATTSAPADNPDAGSREGWVPLERAERMAANAARRERESVEAVMEARLKEMETRLSQGRQTQEREFTRSELRRAVEAGTITEDRMDEILDRQQEARLERTVETRLGEARTAQSEDREIDTILGRYRSLVPEAWQEGSDERMRVKRNFERLVARGAPADRLSTELTAIEMAFGDVDTLQRSRAPTPSHEETDTGGEDSGTGNGLTKDGWPKGMPARQKAFYETQLRKGLYKSVADVAKEWQRHGGKARTVARG